MTGVQTCALPILDKVEYRDDGIQLEADVDAHLAAQVVEQSID